MDLDGAEEILGKNGITGYDRVLKTKKIGFCYQILEMNNEFVFSDLDFTDYEFSITQDEFITIKKYFSELKSIFENYID